MKPAAFANRRLFLRGLSGLLLVPGLRCVVCQGETLFAQSASTALHDQFDSKNLSWLLLDSSGRILAQRWLDAEQALSPGSLLKPFIAFAYSEQYKDVFPHIHCAGTRDRCWLASGHGALGLEDALAHSCNAYFLALAACLDAGRTLATFRPLGLAGLPQSATPAALIGLSGEWRETPLTLAQAYLALLKNRTPVRNWIARGMQKAAQTGTASALASAPGKLACLAKTGTAACTHHPRAAADGFSVVLYPAEQPRILLLLRMHGATGAQSCAEAANMLDLLGLRA